ncbi:membrane protein [Microbacterium phage RikSengupta]|nr:membrane protein [Microbacterium phage TinyMiny]WMI33136.1 membrane protein [Microbacterium phage RikSengupta]
MILNKYAVALLQVLLLFVAALQAALTDGLITPTEYWQLAGLFVGAVVTYYARILDAGWAGALKVAGAVLGALIAAVIPFLTTGWTSEAIAIVALAVINALATQFGVDMRVDSAKEIIAKNGHVTDAIVEVDPKAAVSAANQISTIPV